MKGKAQNILVDHEKFQLHEKQQIALTSHATEILYGGAMGGGKSHFLRIYSIIVALAVPYVQIYLFRRTKKDLAEQHNLGLYGYKHLLAELEASGECAVNDDGIKFTNGSNIIFGYMDTLADFAKFQGKQFNVLLIDELTHFPEDYYRLMRQRVRAPAGLFKDFYKKEAHIIAATNPMSIGHMWVKNSFVSPCKPMTIWKTSLEDGAMLRQYVPARLQDNPSIDYDQYVGKISGSGGESYVRAMLDGDWEVVEGAFFEDWDSSKHIIQPFNIPNHWIKFRSMDSGFREPFSVGWWAIAAETTQTSHFEIPEGAMIRYREFYGAQKDKEGRSIPNVGLKLTAEDLGRRIAEIESKDVNLQQNRCVIDPSAFNQVGTISVAERMWRGSNGRVAFRKAINRRKTKDGKLGGWDVLRSRLRGENSRPMIYCFSECLDSIRTIPGLVYSTAGIDDMADKQEDHAADDWRYACMDNPLPSQAELIALRSKTDETVYAQSQEARPGMPGNTNGFGLISKLYKEEDD